MPRCFEEDALLRVDALGLSRAEPEESRVEQVDIRDHAAHGDEVWIVKSRWWHTRCLELKPGKLRNRFDAAPQVAPELADVLCSRKPAAHPDDRYGVSGSSSLVPTHRPIPSLLCRFGLGPPQLARS